MRKGQWRNFKYGVVKKGQVIEILREEGAEIEVVEFLEEKEFPRYWGHDNYFQVRHLKTGQLEDICMEECPKGNEGYKCFFRSKFRIIK